MKHFFQDIDGWSQLTEQGELLNTILKLVDTNKKIEISEIGVYKGRCTAMWNVILNNNNIKSNYYAIDHFEGSNEHDKSVDYYNITVNNLQPILNTINLIKQDSITASKTFDDKKFDIIYIDASHEYEFVKQDIIHWLPKLKNGGIICGDDYIKGWDGVIQAVDEIFGKENIIKIGNQQWYIQIK